MLEHLDRMVIKRTFPPITGQPIFGRMLSTLQRSALVAEIRAHPDHFVGQDEMPLSTAPVWLGQKLEPRPLVMRMYVAAAGDSYAVMPGGLTRIAAHGDVPIVSMQRGGGSKDTWVLADGPVSSMSLLAPPTIEIQRERANRRSSEPRGGQPVLAGTLRRASGALRAAAAQRRRAAGG